MIAMPPAEITIKCIVNLLDSLAPCSLAEDWDNVGLLVGSPEEKVTGIMIGLDPTTQLLDEAIERGANLVITHHPIIFTPLKSIRTDQPTGALLAKAIAHRLNIIACHTNLDVVPNGVSHILAQHLGLTELSPLSPSNHAGSDIGCGQIGLLPEPLTGQQFLQHLCQALDLPALTWAGRLPETICRLAVCGGSGSEFAAIAHAQGAQLLITGEVKHHIARWAEEADFCVIDAGHFPTESLICKALAAQIAALLTSQTIKIPVLVTEKQNNPFSFFIAGNDQQTSNERYGQ